MEAITETPYIDLQQNSWVMTHLPFREKPYIILSMTIIQDQRTQFKKVGDADPEILGTLNDGLKIVDINDNIYFIGDSWFIEYEGEQLTYNDRIWFNMNNFNLNYSKLEVYNNEIYTVNSRLIINQGNYQFLGLKFLLAHFQSQKLLQ